MGGLVPCPMEAAMLKTMTIDPFIHSIAIEVDWETHDSRLDDAVEELFAATSIQGHVNKIKSHLRALLIICARLLRDTPDYYAAYPRNNNFDHQATHYNPLGLKMRSMKKVIDALRPDYLDHHNGYNWFADKEAKRSRLRPNDRLVAFMNKHQLGDIRYNKVLIRGGIILKSESDKVLIDYPDTEETHQMRENLSVYNAFIEQTDISAMLHEGFRLGFYESNRSYRVFNGDFTLNGRFYGGWWQGLNKTQRQGIRIKGRPIVELDYKSNHLCFLYGLENTAMPQGNNGDLYDIGADIPREIIKQIIMLSLNTRSSNGTWVATKNFMAGLEGKKKELWDRYIPNKPAYDRLVALIKEAHPVVEGYFYHYYGMALMNLDSRVAEFVMMRMTEQNIPCLSIHDSFIVQEDKEEELRRAMHEAYDFIGYPLALPSIERV